MAVACVGCPSQQDFDTEQCYTAKMLHFIHHENVDEHFKVRWAPSR